MNNQLKSVLEEQFLFKRISVPIPARNDKGIIIPNKFQQCTGICQYIGDNKTLNYDLQVTVNGMPIQILNINDIKLFTTNSRIRKS